jgi:hypothetical protein
MKKLQVITFSDKDLGSENKLLQSCKKNDLELIVLTYHKQWASNAIKIKLLFDYLKTVEAEQLLLITDAFDVLINAFEDDILKAFSTFEKDIIFGAEANFYFRNHRIKKNYQAKYPESETIYKYLNSGTFIGKAVHLQMLLDDIISKNQIDISKDASLHSFVSDQYLYSKHFVEHFQSSEKRYSIGLDQFHYLFEVTGGRSRVMNLPYITTVHAYNAYKLERAVLKFFGLNQFQSKLTDIYFDQVKQQFKNTITGTNPLVIHAPGTWQYFVEILDAVKTGKKLRIKNEWPIAKSSAVIIGAVCYFISLCIPFKLTI